MKPGEFYKSEHHRWALSIVLALLLQAIAFSFWAGRLDGRVTEVIRALGALHADFTAHVNRK